MSLNGVRTLKQVASVAAAMTTLTGSEMTLHSSIPPFIHMPIHSFIHASTSPLVRGRLEPIPVYLHLISSWGGPSSSCCRDVFQQHLTGLTLDEEPTGGLESHLGPTSSRRNFGRYCWWGGTPGITWFYQFGWLGGHLVAQLISWASPLDVNNGSMV